MHLLAPGLSQEEAAATNGEGKVAVGRCVTAVQVALNKQALTSWVPASLTWQQSALCYKTCVPTGFGLQSFVEAASLSTSVSTAKLGVAFPDLPSLKLNCQSFVLQMKKPEHNLSEKGDTKI